MRKKMAVPTVLALLLAATTMWADTAGTFRGVVIHGPEMTPGWMYMKSVNGQVRRVGISRARVVYSDAIPVSERQKMPALSIGSGAEVRVTAQQDNNGEWRATRIEILSLHGAATIEPSERSESLRST
jgi:hypothetical protein